MRAPWKSTGAWGCPRRCAPRDLRRDVPMDVYVVLDLTRPPLLRLPYPSVAEAEADIRATCDGTAPLEPYQLISQYTLEPLLKAEAEKLPSGHDALVDRIPFA